MLLELLGSDHLVEEVLGRKDQAMSEQDFMGPRDWRCFPGSSGCRGSSFTQRSDRTLGEQHAGEADTLDGGYQAAGCPDDQEILADHFGNRTSSSSHFLKLPTSSCRVSIFLPLP